MRKTKDKKIFRMKLPARARVYRLPLHMRMEEAEPVRKPVTVKPDSEEVRLRKSGRWQRLRDVAVNTHPTCMVCLRNKAVLVHHIVPASENIDLFFDLSNLAPLCVSCHRKVHEAYERGIEPGIVFPEDRRLQTWQE